MTVLITGIGWVNSTGMGCGREHSRFEMPAGRLPRITRKSISEEPYQRFGRMDSFSRLGLAAIAFALKDADLETWTRKRNISIIASTVHGCLSTDLSYFDTVIPQEGRLASPNLFAYTLPNSFLGEAAIHFGLTGSSYTISSPSASKLQSLRMAIISLDGGESEKVLSGICDLESPDLFARPGKEIPGALFFMIEKSSKKIGTAYGEVGLDRKGMLNFNGSKVEDIVNLVRRCLTAKHAKVKGLTAK
jgi:3-oxoacyl-[acyl-carrier-protein] synthase II